MIGVSGNEATAFNVYGISCVARGEGELRYDEAYIALETMR